MHIEVCLDFGAHRPQAVIRRLEQRQAGYPRFELILEPVRNLLQHRSGAARQRGQIIMGGIARLPAAAFA